MDGSNEWIADLVSFGCFTIIPLSIAIGVFGWMSSRSKRAMARGLSQFAEGRILEAYDTFEVCNGKLVLRGQASLWLWRLNQARSELDLAATMFEHRDEGLAAPFLALVAALRNDRDVEAWLVRSQARSVSGKPEAKLALAVFELRQGRYREALNATPADLGNPRGRALATAVRDWSQVHLTGESRPLDAVTFLGEGGPVELERHWPELAAALRAGRLEKTTEPS
jgi:hypothetical protein